MNKKLFALVATCLTLCFSHLSLAANPQIEIKTNQGTIIAELYADKAPKTVANFLKYVNDGFYNGTIFHRVINNFMIQGGGFTPDMKEKTTRSPIENEAPQATMAGLINAQGTLAMARTNQPHSATAQFFINLRNNAALDYPGRDGWGYAVFGKVTKGFDVVQKIGFTQTTSAGYYQDVPATPIIIESVTIVTDKK